MPTKTPVESSPALTAQWPLPGAATLGSSVRLKGIEREVRRRLPWTLRKSVVATTGQIVLTLPEAEQDQFAAVSATIAKTLEGIEALPILPSEAEDILSISPRERQKWLKDGRLKSAGTRTVKLRGRAKAVTFHVFEPRHIEDILDGDLPVRLARGGCASGGRKPAARGRQGSAGACRESASRQGWRSR